MLRYFPPNSMAGFLCRRPRSSWTSRVAPEVELPLPRVLRRVNLRAYLVRTSFGGVFRPSRETGSDSKEARMFGNQFRLAAVGIGALLLLSACAKNSSTTPSSGGGGGSSSSGGSAQIDSSSVSGV